MQAQQVSACPAVSWPVDLSRRAQSWRWFMRNVLIPFAYTRALLLFAGWFAITWLPSARAVGWNKPTSWTAINMWARWDSGWYLSIAKYGYHFIPNAQCNIAFAPLYPLLMRVGGWLGGGSDSAFYIAGIVIANIFLLVGVAELVALIQSEGYDEITGNRAAWSLLLFPTSLFFSAAYPMSLFLALAIMSFSAARKNRWSNAGLLLGLATLARPDGVLLGVGLAAEYFHQHKLALKRDILWLACGPAAILGWMAYQWRNFGSPLSFVSVQKIWGYYTLSDLLHSPNGWVQLVGPALFAVLIFIGIWNLRPCYSFFAIVMFGVMLASPRYCSLARYIIVLFPAYMMLAIIGRRWRMVHRIYMVLAMLLSMLCMTRFALCLWLA
jgi:hypothetical protein